MEEESAMIAEISTGLCLAKNPNLLELIVNDSNDAIISMTLDGTIVSWNEAAEKMYGYAPAEIIGKSISIVVPMELKNEYPTILNEIGRGERVNHFETVRIRKDQTRFNVSLAISPIKDSKGTIVGASIIARDITEHKKVEEQLKKACLDIQEEAAERKVLNEKLEVVGKLTRHDIRNKLAVAKGNAYLIKKRVGDSVEVHKYLKEIDLAISLIERILDFNQIYEQVGVESIASIDVGGYFDEAVSMFNGLGNVQIVNECRGLTVFADSLLRQIFYNLIDNSVKYGQKLSCIRLYFETSETALRIVYEDDGVGIPEEEKTKMFHEGHGKGTGYGLFLIKTICDGYGWKIEETGNHGEGARFTMTISAEDYKTNV